MLSGPGLPGRLVSTSMAATFMLGNQPEELAGLMTQVHAFGARAGLPPRAADRAALVIEELVANAIAHGYPQAGAGTIHVEIRVQGSHVAIAIRDDGRTFDPFSQAMPDVDAALDDRPIGGLGLHLVRSMARNCRHRRADGWNVVDLTMDFEA